MAKNEKADLTKELTEISKCLNKEVENTSELSIEEINEIIHDYRAKKKNLKH